MNILIVMLILGHLLYDFHWQGPYIAEMKGKSDLHLYVHALTWTLLMCVILYYLGSMHVWKFIFLLLTHFVIDRIKARGGYTSNNALMIDQSAHLITLIIVAV